MASSWTLFQTGNLVRFRQYSDWKVGLIVALGKDSITVYTERHGCITITKESVGTIELVSRPYSRVI